MIERVVRGFLRGFLRGHVGRHAGIEKYVGLRKKLVVQNLVVVEDGEWMSQTIEADWHVPAKIG